MLPKTSSISAKIKWIDETISSLNKEYSKSVSFRYGDGYLVGQHADQKPFVSTLAYLQKSKSVLETMLKIKEKPR